MAQEEKQLLLTDLCGRLPYKVKVEAVPYVEPQILCSIDPIRKEFRLDFGEYRNIFATNWVGEEYSIVKPYLRPLSSMTEEEYKEYDRATDLDVADSSETLRENLKAKSRVRVSKWYHGTDWLNAHHFDYRGLIEMGLALKAPEGMYKTE